MGLEADRAHALAVDLGLYPTAGGPRTPLAAAGV